MKSLKDDRLDKKMKNKTKKIWGLSDAFIGLLILAPCLFILIKVVDFSDFVNFRPMLIAVVAMAVVAAIRAIILGIIGYEEPDETENASTEPKQVERDESRDQSIKPGRGHKVSMVLNMRFSPFIGTFIVLLLSAVVLVILSLVACRI
jgi:hypothetical protein